MPLKAARLSDENDSVLKERSLIVAFDDYLFFSCQALRVNFSLARRKLSLAYPKAFLTADFLSANRVSAELKCSTMVLVSNLWSDLVGLWCGRGSCRITIPNVFIGHRDFSSVVYRVYRPCYASDVDGPAEGSGITPVLVPLARLSSVPRDECPRQSRAMARDSYCCREKAPRALGRISGCIGRQVPAPAQGALRRQQSHNRAAALVWFFWPERPISGQCPTRLEQSLWNHWYWSCVELVISRGRFRHH